MNDRMKVRGDLRGKIRLGKNVKERREPFNVYPNRQYIFSEKTCYET